MSYDVYYDEALKKAKAESEKIKQQTNETIDKSAAAQVGVYEQAIEQAPLESRVLYDQNALDEAVNRKKIQETLANMGMTDSGLSSSMHTALTVQKSRADNAVRVDEHQRIQAYESAIDQILANAEAQKATESLNLDRSAMESAASNAASMYNADVEATTKATSMALDYQSNRAKMAQHYIDQGASISEAWGQAYAAYPDTSTAEGVRYAYYKMLREQGYGDTYANNMSKAYVNTLAAGGTQSDAISASTEAMVAHVEREIRDSGVELNSEETLKRYGGAISADKVRNTAATLKAAGLSEVAVAYAMGKIYAEIVAKGDDNTANQVGQALAQHFSGMYLEIALNFAGLQ